MNSLKAEAVKFLKANIETLVDETEHFLENIFDDFRLLSPQALSDVRKSLHEFCQLYLACLEAMDIPEKRVESFSADVGKTWLAQGMKIETIVEVFDAGEAHIWEALAGELLPRGFSAASWLKFSKLREGFNSVLRRSLQKNYVREERSLMERQLYELKALSDLGQTIVSTVELEGVLRQILEVATRLMQAKMGAIMLIDDTGEFVEPVVDFGASKLWSRHEKIPLSRSIAGVAIRRGEYVFARENELDVFELPRTYAGKKIRSVLSVPIPVDGKPIGVIEIYETFPRTYTDLDISLLCAFGPQAGVAIKNARLFSEERRRREQARVLIEISQRLTEAKDFEELIETVTEKTAEALDADRCSLFLYEPEANALSFMSGFGRSTLQAWLLNQFHLPLTELSPESTRAIDSGNPVVVRQVQDERNLEEKIFGGTGLLLSLRVPLIVKEELVGLMRIEYTWAREGISQDDIALAESIGRHAAVAIQNRKFREELFEKEIAIRDAEINEKLYREREKSESILQAIPDAVFMIDSQLTVTFLNPAAEFLTGWSIEEATGRTCHEILYGTSIEPAKCPDESCAIYRVLNSQFVSFSEHEIITRSGRKIRTGATFAPTYSSEGRIESVVAIMRDISEQKELEKYALIQREMDIASGIQSSLLPKSSFEFGGVRIYARQQQARMVGGDWYDYWSYRDKLFVVVGDASGSGVGAALFATMAMSALRVEAREYIGTLEILEHVNASLYNANQSENFVTIFFGVLDLATMTLSYSNAGHEEPLLISPNSLIVEPLSSEKRSLLGIFPRPELDVRTKKFRGGERLLLFTDGIIDSQNRKGKYYGQKRLLRMITANREMDAPEFVDTLIGDVLEFTEGELKDDITILCMDFPQEG
ncbi:MAG: SpoIIE family protein phosphatase [Actinomycetota bacterium]|nr:SpoIIE family protein phosphatase [Actinomycetota bacterium]